MHDAILTLGCMASFASLAAMAMTTRINAERRR